MTGSPLPHNSCMAGKIELTSCCEHIILSATYEKQCNSKPHRYRLYTQVNLPHAHTPVSSELRIKGTSC